MGFNMGLPEKYSYLWTILKGLPFGIGSIIIGITLFLNTSSNVDDLQKVTGQVEWYGVKKIYIKEIEASGNVFAIKIGSEFYFGDKKKEEDKIKSEIPVAYENKAEITIWFVENKTIEQISIDGRIVIPYKPYGTAIFFICFGVLITIGAILYAIKYKFDVGFTK